MKTLWGLGIVLSYLGLCLVRINAKVSHGGAFLWPTLLCIAGRNKLGTRGSIRAIVANYKRGLNQTWPAHRDQDCICRLKVRQETQKSRHFVKRWVAVIKMVVPIRLLKRVYRWVIGLRPQTIICLQLSVIHGCKPIDGCWAKVILEKLKYFRIQFPVFVIYFPTQ